MNVDAVLALLTEGSKLADTTIKAWTAHKAKLDAEIDAVRNHQKLIDQQGPVPPPNPDFDTKE